MSWFKVDDRFWRSLKRGRVSTEAVGLWICAGSWARDNKTGGYVPETALAQIVPDVPHERAVALAAELVGASVEGIHEHGLWKEIANGWQFHDWEQFQPEDELEQQRRENISKVRSEAGRRGALARWGRDGKNSFANGNDGNPGSTRAGVRGDPPPLPPSGSDPVSVQEDVSDPDHVSCLGRSQDVSGSARVSGKSGSGTGPFRSEDERAVFEHWATNLWPLVHRHGRTPRATGPRVSRIRARLRNYSVAELKRVIDRVTQSRFHLGDNDAGKPYIEPKTIFANDEKVDEWLAKAALGEPRRNMQEDTEARAADEAERQRVRQRLAAKAEQAPPHDQAATLAKLDSLTGGTHGA